MSGALRFPIAIGRRQGMARRPIGQEARVVRPEAKAASSLLEIAAPID